MSQTILGALTILGGAACACLTMAYLWANAIGAATAPDQVNNAPAIWLAILALAGVVGGILLIVLR